MHSSASPAGPGTGAPDTYRSPLAVLAWWVWLAFAAANLIDIAVQGRDHLSAVAAATLVLITGIVYVAAQRPRVLAAADGIVIRNPLRDHRVPWPAVTDVDLRDLLRVHCAWPEPGSGPPGGGSGILDGGQDPPPVAEPGSGQRTRVIQAWALQSPRRAGVISGLHASFGPGGLARRSVGGQAATAGSPGAVHRQETQRITRALAERARRARADAPGLVPDPASAWSWRAVLAVVLPALLLVAVILA